MKIVGAGMAGLIAANYFRRNPGIYEIQSGLPHNHTALLRFRSDAISKATGIAFRKVMVHKAIVHGHHFLDFPNPFACNQYSLKVAGRILERSVWNTASDFRYIAPPNFIQQLALGVAINYNYDFNPNKTEDEPIISTIPMPIMMKKLNWKHQPSFERKPIWALNADIINPETDVYQTIYFADLENPCYRASIVGNKLIAEFIADEEKDPEDLAEEVLDFFGIPLGAMRLNNLQFKKQEYGKIMPIDEDIRKEFMYTLTREYNIYSLGRFATWRQILLDDLIHDLEVINDLIKAEGRRRLYHQSLVQK